MKSWVSQVHKVNPFGAVLVNNQVVPLLDHKGQGEAPVIMLEMILSYYLVMHSLTLRYSGNVRTCFNEKAKQHSTPKAVTFPKKNELPRVGLEPMTLHSR